MAVAAVMAETQVAQQKKLSFLIPERFKLTLCQKAATPLPLKFGVLVAVVVITLATNKAQEGVGAMRLQWLTPVQCPHFKLLLAVAAQARAVIVTEQVAMAVAVVELVQVAVMAAAAAAVILVYLMHQFHMPMHWSLLVAVAAVVQMVVMQMEALGVAPLVYKAAHPVPVVVAGLKALVVQVPQEIPVEQTAQHYRAAMVVMVIIVAAVLVVDITAAVVEQQLIMERTELVAVVVLVTVILQQPVTAP
jgi:phosphate starvation-inducible membrane PsiE